MRYDDYLALLAMHESQGSGNYDAHHGSYLGRYQLGPYGLQDAGFMDKQGNWTGKYDVHSAIAFRQNPDAQETAIDTFNMKNWGYIKRYGFDSYIGDSINGTEITPYGLLAGYHLLGYGNAARAGLHDFLESRGAIDPVDSLGTPISRYIRNMSGYPDPADNFSRGPFVAFPDPFADHGNPFAQGFMPDGWDQLSSLGLSDPNAVGSFADDQDKTLADLANQLDELHSSIQALEAMTWS